MDEVTTNDVYERKVSILLIIGIILIPFVFSWPLLRKGHSTRSRVLGFGWLAISLLMAFSGYGEELSSREPDAKATSANPSTAGGPEYSQLSDSYPAEDIHQTIEEFKDSLLHEVGSLRPKWDSIKISEASDRSYRLAVIYKESAKVSGYGEVATDTKFIARKVLRTLMSQGRKPTDEWIFVSVHARQPAGTGETGTPLTRMLGSSTYDFSSDQLVFRGPGK